MTQIKNITTPGGVDAPEGGLLSASHIGRFLDRIKVVYQFDFSFGHLTDDRIRREDFGMTISQRSIAINVAALLFLIAAGTASAQNSVNVTIPGNTLGGFGNPSIDNSEPFVAALAVDGPGTITVSYLSGLVTEWRGGSNRLAH
jgi:hypothetical protein